MPIVDSSRMECVSDAAAVLRDCPIVDVRKWSDRGQEHYHSDVGEYWLPAHITVEGDMDDMAVLRVLSDVMDSHGLKVHVHHGVEECGDDWARLVPG